jgi:hypothetical protein
MHAIRAHDRMQVLQTALTSALNKGERSALRHGQSTLQGRRYEQKAVRVAGAAWMS